jgi:type III restriction enzyme
MANLMEHTSPPMRVTRRTLLELFRRLGVKKTALDNPHEWATTAVRVLKEKLADHLVNGIQYEKIAEGYEMQQILDEDAVELFSKYIMETGDAKSVYDLIPCDSEVESKFVEDLEARKDVRLYLKLPYWFTVPTPVGEYRPDWAVVMDGPESEGKPVLYLVSETKSSPRKDGLRPNEWRKIQCGAAHFGSRQMQKKGALDGVDYKVVASASELP